MDKWMDGSHLVRVCMGVWVSISSTFICECVCVYRQTAVERAVPWLGWRPLTAFLAWRDMAWRGVWVVRPGGRPAATRDKAINAVEPSPHTHGHLRCV
mmetsp:Transcript_45843/g.113966  ORF Transcript_45843/g.113966 Transcript_45843/m.113966 type:complete len:98 (-) Transcript_45843:2377-2670(-)